MNKKEFVSVSFDHGKKDLMSTFLVNGIRVFLDKDVFPKLENEAKGFCKLTEAESIVGLAKRIDNDVAGSATHKSQFAFMCGWCLMQMSDSFKKHISMNLKISKVKFDKMSKAFEFFHDASHEKVPDVSYLITSVFIGASFFKIAMKKEKKKKECLPDCKECDSKEKCPIYKTRLTDEQ